MNLLVYSSVDDDDDDKGDYNHKIRMLVELASMRM